MTVSAKDLLKFEIKPFLLGVFFSRIVGSNKEEIPDQFYVYTHFKSSKAVSYVDFDFIVYSSDLKNKYNSFSGYENWEVHKVSPYSVELRFYIKNDLKITTTNFYNLIYQKAIQERWLYEEEMNIEKRLFMIGFMETRGSVDLSGRYISQDYFYNNTFELKRIQIFTDLINIPYGYLNFNPRNLQEDYISGKNKRNTQFRISIHYYAKIIGFINEYKAKIYENNWKPQTNSIENGIITFEVELPKVSDTLSFLKYLNFFTNNIYRKELTPNKIENLRKALGFTKNVDSSKTNRNKTIIELYDQISPDECGLCGTKTTFTKNNGRQSFEIHHVIPFHNGKQYDNMANLIKLCPTCHSSLKKGRATKQEQIVNLISILHKHPEIFEYTSSTLGIADINNLASEIYYMLG